jgi:hypothetical protein
VKTARELNFLYDNQHNKLLERYGEVRIVRKTPNKLSKLQRFSLAKATGDISYNYSSSCAIKTIRIGSKA